MAREKVVTGDDIVSLEPRSVKLEFPISLDTDCMMVFTGNQPPDAEAFVRLRAMIDVVESSILGTQWKKEQPQQVVGVPPAIKGPERKKQSKAKSRKPRADKGVARVSRKSDPARAAFIVQEWTTNRNGRSLYRFAKDLQIPHSSVQHVLRRKGLLPGGKSGDAAASTVSSHESSSHGVSEGGMRS